MAKIVRYNGGTMSYLGCSEPTELVIGEEYEVISENDRRWQTDYTLRGVKGSFNSCWFEDVLIKNTYMAISHTVPVREKSMDCFKITTKDGKTTMSGCKTSTVKNVVEMGNGIYKVYTRNSLYIVQVG